MGIINEYPGHKISALTFVPTPLQESIIVTGTCDQGSDNRIQVWMKLDNELELLHEDLFIGDVHAITFIQDSLVAATSSKGTLFVYHLNNHQLDQVSESLVSKGPANDIVFNHGSKDMIAVGEDGSLSLVNLSRLSDNPVRKSISSTPLTCIECLDENKVMVGNTAGHIKLVDLRSGKTESSFPNNLNCLTVIRQNPGSHHFIMAGYQTGNIALWDLRNKNPLPLEMSTHDASVTGMQFLDGDGVMVTSSLDGHLLQWTLDPSCMVSKVDPLIRPISIDGPAISCFHYRRGVNNEIAFANDREVLSVYSYQ